MDYNEDRHEYSENGRIIPSVTQILYPSSKPWFSKTASDRGHVAHELCAAYARDPKVFPLEPYADAFALWCFKCNPTWLAIEEIIDGDVDGYRYAGRIDGLAMINGKKILCDWKTGVRSKTFYAQIGAYALSTKPTGGLILYLHDDMTYTEDWMRASVLAYGIMEFRVALRNYYA